MATDFNLREAFKIKDDPETKQTTVIPEEKTVDLDSLPPKEQIRIYNQFQIIYAKIEEMEQSLNLVRDDKLHDALYEQQGISSREVAQCITMLRKIGSVSILNVDTM